MSPELDEALARAYRNHQLALLADAFEDARQATTRQTPSPEDLVAVAIALFEKRCPTLEAWKEQELVRRWREERRIPDGPLADRARTPRERFCTAAAMPQP